jgi:hypothetical protein
MVANDVQQPNLSGEQFRMQPTNSTIPTRKQPHGKRAHDTRSFDRRLKAAGLDNDTIPDNADEFRYQLARRISMFVNHWHGCPELLCQRNRGCMAPNNSCTNIEKESDEERRRTWPQTQVEVYKALKEHIAKLGLEDAD